MRTKPKYTTSSSIFYPLVSVSFLGVLYIANLEQLTLSVQPSTQLQGILVGSCHQHLLLGDGIYPRTRLCTPLAPQGPRTHLTHLCLRA